VLLVGGEVLMIATFYSDWGIPEWVSVVGLPVGIVAVFLTWRQLRKTATAAGAAKDAVERTEQHLAENQLLLLIPRMLQHARDLDHAVHRTDREAAQACLTDWRNAATQVRVLAARTNAHPNVAHHVRTAVALISTAHDELGNPERNAAEATRRVRDRMSDAGDAANEIITERLVFVNTENA
jgi:hypothetical protein